MPNLPSKQSHSNAITAARHRMSAAQESRSRAPVAGPQHDDAVEKAREALAKAYAAQADRAVRS